MVLNRISGKGSSATVLIVGGTAVATVLLLKNSSSFFRRLIQWLDPIQPPTASIDDSVRSIDNDDNLDDLLERLIQEREGSVIQGAEQHVIWANQSDNKKNKKTPISIVFLHGWGACQQECAPIPERLADQLGANLFLGRLPGHGRRHTRGVFGPKGPNGTALLEEATPQELFLYSLKAWKIGKALGDRVVLMGMSTGGALATWLASRIQASANDDEQALLAGLVLLSPAFALGHPLYPVLRDVFSSLRLLPFVGHYLRSTLIELVLGGKTRHLHMLSEDHMRYNCLIYPTRAVLNLLDVLWECSAYQKENCSSRLNVPTIMLGNPQDTVINFRTEATNFFLERLGEVPKAFYCITTSEHAHVIGSEMLSPSAVDEVYSAIFQFLEAHVVQNIEEKVLAARSRPVLQQRPFMSKAKSVPTGLGSFASIPSFADLSKPFEF